ncbi:AEC family transporter [Anditalea andensis]|uniref:Permease n=1 Tax=Anditalea andensis TaxID=1048983 RepID=A0A074L0Y4_9BACT|nr:permease [Anditalea andensis]KEO74100.1 hypothetical protein EL17_08115 [Anditalea andensis]
MSIALQKTLSLLLLIVIGFLLKQKLIKEDHKKGLKTIILDIALPAMIFVALLKIEINPDLLMLPILALVFNVIMILGIRYVLPVLGIEANTPSMRTLMLLLPSLAPGLSCFPFLVEYLGDEVLAWGALADIGNKLFVLLISYLLAMHWFYKSHHLTAISNGQRIKELVMAMVKEPINMVMLVAIVLLSFGIRLETMPLFLSESIIMLKNMMTPLVLLFIGVAVIFKWDQLKMITSLLIFRSGITFLLSGIFVLLVPLPSEAAVMLAVVFPQSACSFWPFAHMSAIRAMELEKDSLKKNMTFDLELGINVLALSLPFSTLLILGIFTSGSYFMNPFHILLVGTILLGVALVPKILTWARNADTRWDSILKTSKQSMEE